MSGVTGTATLTTRDLTARFGGVVALDHVSVDIAAAGNPARPCNPDGADSTSR